MHARHPYGFARAFALGCAVATLASVACSRRSDDALPPLSVVRLATQTWAASKFDATVAQILAKNALGATIELVEIDEYKQWPLIASGELDGCLENWPSGHAEDRKTYIETGRIEDGGPLGAAAKIGWYVPSYMVLGDPSLAAWGAYQDPKKAALFRTPETGEAGRILLGDPTWVSFENDIIRNLKLDLQVTYAGGEDPLLAELDRAYARRDPILMQLWIPHAALTKYDMTRVELPPNTPACYAKAMSGGVDCDYPSDALFKTFWPDLSQRAPRVYKLLRAISFTTREQVEFLTAISVNAKTIEQASQDWVDANSATWTPWVAP